MTGAHDARHDNDPFQLNRFVSAQERVYEGVLEELRDGQKRSHWIWYIFPQIEGLAYSSTSKYYAITGIEEARQYLDHPVLGVRLMECTQILLAIEGRSISQIFGYPDDMKLRSSMTLFAQVSAPRSVFVRVLDKYFNGEHDDKTLRILEKLQN